MRPIAQRFHHLKAQGATALIPFITAGDPDLGTTALALQALDANGADVIELGIPYSDPLADGPVIQAAATRALQGGTTLPQVLEMLSGLSLQAPVILFTYYNPIYQVGIPEFLAQVKAAGGSGLVVPDLPLEESEPLLQAAQAEDLDVILLVAPTSPPERMHRIGQRSSGFVYLVSTLGVTGQRAEVAAQVQQLLLTLRQHTTLPIGVGFGISSPEQAYQVAQWGADAVIVGSAFVQRLSQAPDPETGIAALSQFCQELKGALQPVAPVP